MHRLTSKLRLLGFATMLLSGCSLLFGLPAAENLSADASTLVDGQDQMRDAGRTDPPISVDAEADASTDAPASKRCVFQAGRFCEDFENDAGLNCSLIMDPGALATVVTGSADTPSRYLSFSFVAAGGNKVAFCATPAGVLGSTSVYRVAMALRFDAQLGAGTRVMTLYPNVDESVRMVWVSNGTTIRALMDATLVDGGMRYSEPLGLQAPLGPYGVWHTVSIEIDTSQKTAQLAIDGVSRPKESLTDVRLNSPANPIVRFGSDYSPGLVGDNAFALDTLVLEPR